MILATEEHRQIGFHGFYADVKARVAAAQTRRETIHTFIRQSAERYANICLGDALPRPLQFLRQMSGKPPVCFGTPGFRQSIVDDQEPARHYTAFVFIGYWLPTLLAIPFLWAWETLGFFRYGHWSQPDIRSGLIGIRHGRTLRKAGYTQWPDLLKRDLAETTVDAADE